MAFAIPKTRAAKLVVIALALNEIRGVCVVAGFLLTAHGRLF